jgi:hypothetical protein
MTMMTTDRFAELQGNATRGFTKACNAETDPRLARSKQIDEIYEPVRQLLKRTPGVIKPREDERGNTIVSLDFDGYSDDDIRVLRKAIQDRLAVDGVASGIAVRSDDGVQIRGYGSRIELFMNRESNAYERNVAAALGIEREIHQVVRGDVPRGSNYENIVTGVPPRAPKGCALQL